MSSFSEMTIRLKAKDIPSLADQPFWAGYHLHRSSLQILANQLLFAGYTEQSLCVVFSEILDNGKIPWQLDAESLNLLRQISKPCET